MVSVVYGDGIRRALSNGGYVLVGGKGRAIAGAISMEQVTTDCGDDMSVRAGHEVVFMGTQGDQTITCLEIAEHL